MSKLKVLIVDADQESRELLVERLKAADFWVIEGRTGGSGLILAEEESPNIIITELDLPDFDGLHLVERIRGTVAASEVPIIVLTRRRVNQEETIAKEKGANLYFQKPYVPETFLQAVQELAANYEVHTSKDGDRRSFNRLVTEQLEIEIRLDDYLLRGITTGINENGMGAQVNLLEQYSDNPNPISGGQDCEIIFRSMKYPLLPCKGKVSRLDESWDDRYQHFIAIEFNDEEVGGMAGSDKESLRDWIQGQLLDIKQ